MIKFPYIFTGFLLFCFIDYSYADQKTVLMACAKIAKNVERLACYDNAVAAIASQEPAGKNSLSKEAQLFGQEHIKTQSTEQSVDFVIKSLKQNTNKGWLITFNNGQVWQQKDAEYLSLSVGDSVQLSKGALGAIFLQKNGSNRKIKVRRQK